MSRFGETQFPPSEVLENVVFGVFMIGLVVAVTLFAILSIENLLIAVVTAGRDVSALFRIAP